MHVVELFTVVATSAGFVVAIVGSSCGFMYWMLSTFEKRIEDKLGHMEYNFEQRFSGLENNVKTIADDVKDQRKRSDQLYEIIVQMMVAEKKQKKEKGSSSK